MAKLSRKVQERWYRNVRVPDVARDALARYYDPWNNLNTQILTERIVGEDGRLGSTDGVDSADPTRESDPDVLLFDGSDDRVEITDPPPLSLERPFEIVAVAKIADGSDAFDLDELSEITNLSSEFAVERGVGDRIARSAPSNWNPDKFVINCWGEPSFDYDLGGQRRILHMAFGDADNYIMLSIESDGTLRGRVRYHGVNYDATLTKPFSAGDEVYFSMRLPGVDNVVTLYADTDDDNVLETAQSAQRVGTVFPKKTSSGRLVLDSEDQGLRWVKSGGRVHVEDGSPAGGLIALVGRDGRYVFTEA